MSGPDDEDASTAEVADDDGFVPATVEDASGYGLSLTLIGGVLLALAYYGYLAVTGPQTLGQAIPEPFYLLVFALLFVLELFQSRERGAMAVVRAIVLAIFYGGLTAFAIEGGYYLWNTPEAALDGFVGVTVLAVSLIVAALAYFCYLSVIESSTTDR
ncbi:hypothetical protein [Natronorubrum sp. FCH18a]|uniref:hypothetical protein n=1 Tax=Natronorubrum sp. FCH18a TaxID=3447018 RepID=UPI003F5112E1